MAINRFDKFPEYDFSFTEYQAQPFVPDLTGLDKTLADLQTEYDNLPKLEVPKYIQESPSDVAAVKQYKNKYTSLKDNIVDQFASGNIVGGRRLMSEMQRTIEKDKQPGGDYYELENRYNQYQKEKERLQEFFKDNPRMINYGLSQIGITDFRDSKTGEANPIIGASVYKDFDQKEFNDWLNQTVDNIKDTLIKDGLYTKRQLDAVTDLHEFRQVMGRDFDDIYQSLVAQMPDEYKTGLQQRYAAEKFYGNTNANSPAEYLDRVLQGAAFGRARREVDVDRIKNVDELDLYRRKKQIDDEWNQTLLRTPVYTNNSGMPDINNLVIGPDGSVGSNKTYEANVQGGTYGTPSYLKTGKNKDRKPLFKDFIQSEEAQQRYPELVKEYNALVKRYPEKMANMSHKDAAAFTQKIYNQKKDKLSVDDAIIRTYGDQEKDFNEAIIGKNGRGKIAMSSIIITEPGKPARTLNYKQFLDYVGLEPEDIVDQLRFYGDMDVDNPLIPSGDYGILTKDNGKQYQVIVSPEDISQLQQKEGAFTLFDPLFRGNEDQSAPAYTGINSLDQLGKWRIIAEDVLESDFLKEQIARKDLLPEERKEYQEKLDRIKNNPMLDNYMSRKGTLINASTGLPELDRDTDKPITPSDLRDLIELQTSLNRNR